MAAIEHLGSPGAPAWFVLRGRVWEGDVWERGHRVTVLISSRSAAREALQRTGTLAYARMRFEETPA
jgi:hypothetical protein